MTRDARTVLHALFYGANGGEPLGGTDFAGLERDTRVRSPAAALSEFAEALVEPAGATVPASSSRAEARAEHINGDRSFLRRAAALVREEIAREEAGDREFAAALARAAASFRAGPTTWSEESRNLLWGAFFPEGASCISDPESTARDIRRRREVELIAGHPRPLRDIATELIITSNVLLTVPEAEYGGDDSWAHEALRVTAGESQSYYYDHPVHIGVASHENEVLYGLSHLDEAVAFEKRAGTVAADARVTVVLSVSVTHTALHDVALGYLTAVLRDAGGFDHLSVYAFTEEQCRRLVTALSELSADSSHANRELEEVFGVDGEYGRHYSFLKAIAAVWQVFVEPRTRATFKIDLDQVFPEKELVEETGKTAFEHLMSSLWGARGRDGHGDEVELGMIAGALVNQRDIHRGLFTPDVKMPAEVPTGERSVFFNAVPMAASTEGEMMASSSDPRFCHQRVHVTGGTNGILVESLRRHRPFTPTFIGRAEDQAYLMSVLYSGSAPFLRYLHEPGLIMRHDKEAFAGASIAAAAHGRLVGDLVRTLLFSRYAELLPWGFEATKAEFDPFTGAFITRRATTVVFLRLALKCAELVAAGRAEEAENLLDIARQKLSPLMTADAVEAQGEAVTRQRRGWNRFYDLLDRAESATPGGEAADRVVNRAAREVRTIVESARIC